MKMKNTTTILTILLVLTLTLPLLTAPLSTAQTTLLKQETTMEEGEQIHEGHRIRYEAQKEEGVALLETDVLTVMVNTKSSLPHFKWWVTGHNETIYIAKFISLIEFIDENGDGAFQYNETVTAEDMFQYEEGQGQQEHREFWEPYFAFAQGGPYWNFSGFYNITENVTENGEIIGIGFDFELQMNTTKLNETGLIAYSDLYILLRCKMYFQDAQIIVKPDKPDMIYYNISGLAELKVDVVIEGWPWHTNYSMLALRWDITVEEENEHGRYRTVIEGEEVDPNEVMKEGEEKPVKPEDPEDKLTALEFVSEFTSETHAYFGAITNALIVNKTTGEKTVADVTCSYKTDGNNNIILYIAFSYFGNETLEYDPVIGVTEEGYKEAGKIFSGRHGESRYEYRNGMAVLETPVFTVKVTAMGEVVHFLFWNTSDPEVVYHVKFVSMAEFIDENGDNVYQFNETVGGSMLTFQSMEWEFSGFQNITDANGETIGVKFSFNSTGVQGLFRQENLEVDIVCYMFFEDAEVDGVSVKGLTELKFTIVIKDWDWMRDDSMLALRWDISWSNVTEEGEVKPCVEGRDIDMSKEMAEERPMEDKEDRKALEIKCGEQLGYFDYTAKALVDGAEGEATASYATCEDCIRVFLCYPHFTNELVHDPVIGVTTTTVEAEITAGEGTIAGIPIMYIVGGIFLAIVIAVVAVIKKRH